MKTATVFAQAFVNAAMRAKSDSWVARQVADRVQHTNLGIKELRDRYNLSMRTKAALYQQAAYLSAEVRGIVGV